MGCSRHPAVEGWNGNTEVLGHIPGRNTAGQQLLGRSNLAIGHLGLTPTLATQLACHVQPGAGVVLWNTVYLERAAHALRGNGHAVDEALLQYLSPLGWEHINLTGDYLWRSSAKVGAGKFRPLRPL